MIRYSDGPIGGPINANSFHIYVHNLTAQISYVLSQKYLFELSCFKA